MKRPKRLSHKSIEKGVGQNLYFDLTRIQTLVFRFRSGQPILQTLLIGWLSVVIVVTSSCERNLCNQLFLASEDWDIGGKTSVMLCTKCRIKFKKYGVNAHLEIDLDNQTPSDVSHYLFYLLGSRLYAIFRMDIFPKL